MKRVFVILLSSFLFTSCSLLFDFISLKPFDIIVENTTDENLYIDIKYNDWTPPRDYLETIQRQLVKSNSSKVFYGPEFLEIDSDFRSNYYRFSILGNPAGEFAYKIRISPKFSKIVIGKNEEQYTVVIEKRKDED